MNKYDNNYFEKRGLENRFFWDLNAWISYFGKDATFCFLGCGLGHRIFAADYYDAYAEGCDFSWPILNTPYKHLKDRLVSGDVSKGNLYETFGKKFDVVVAYDLLEHLHTIEEVETALQNAYELSNDWLLISVPAIGNPCLEADPTHMIKKTKEWWRYKIRSAGFEIISVPINFAYAHQLILARIKNEN